MATDLLHWNFQNNFSAREAAALILGLDPNSPNIEEWRLDAVLRRMQRDYKAILNAHSERYVYDDDEYEHEETLELLDEARSLDATLSSVWMELLVDFLYEDRSDDPDAEFDDWLSDPHQTDFNSQMFSRREIDRWLKTIGLVSRYEFISLVEVPKLLISDLINTTPWGIPLAKNPVQKVPDEKPVSTKERNTLLTIIAALCKEAKIDYSKHSKAAGLIQSAAASMGVSIGETTIEGHLKKIPDALGARTR